jgi:hypothetical protein
MFFSPAKQRSGRPMPSSSRPMLSSESSARPGIGSAAGTGTYLRHGPALYRVVAPLDWVNRHALALLEDCATLEVIAFTADELSALAMTPVIPGPATSGS